MPHSPLKKADFQSTSISRFSPVTIGHSEDRLLITLYQPRLKECTIDSTNSMERSTSESPIPRLPGFTPVPQKVTDEQRPKTPMAMAHAAMRIPNQLPQPKTHLHDQRLPNGNPPPIQRKRFHHSPRSPHRHFDPRTDTKESSLTNGQDEGLNTGWRYI
jgi:hypothetical protein